MITRIEADKLYETVTRLATLYVDEIRAALESGDPTLQGWASDVIYDVLPQMPDVKGLHGALLRDRLLDAWGVPQAVRERALGLPTPQDVGALLRRVKDDCWAALAAE